MKRNQSATNEPNRIASGSGGERVAVLGCGSVGSIASWCLASAGVCDLVLADKDRLSADNVRRHIGGRNSIGQKKPKLVADFLHARFSNLNLRCESFCFLADPLRLRRLLAEVEIALVAVDHEGAKYLINEMCWELRRPAVYAGVYGGGWGAELVLVDPNREGPCYGCAARKLGRRGIDIWPSEASNNYTMPVSETPSGDWAAADLRSIMPAAACAADLVVAVLEGNRGSDEHLSPFGHPGNSAWRLPFRQVPNLGLQPWRLQRIDVRAQTGCPLCSGAVTNHNVSALPVGGDGLTARQLSETSR